MGAEGETEQGTSSIAAQLARPGVTWLLRVSAATGLLVFTLGLLISATSPGWVERQTRDRVARYLKAELSQKFPAPQGLALPQLAERLRQRAMIYEELLESFCKYDCSEHESLRGAVRGMLAQRVRGLLDSAERVQHWARGRYDQVISEIIRDVRIFSGTNALMFLLALLASWRAPQVKALGVVCASLIAGAAGGSYLYLFGQNWLDTLVFGNYVGKAYAIWVALIVGALLDCLLNRGRVLRAIGSMIGAAVGSAAHGV